MKKWAIVMTVAAFPACAPQISDCVKLQVASQLACGADPKSAPCLEATRMLAERCGGVVIPVPQPTPTPTPTPPPTPPPVEPPPVEPPPVEPPPGPQMCGQEEDLIAGPTCQPQLQAKVVGAMEYLGDPTGMPPQETLTILALELNKLGLCAHAGIEAVFVRRSDGNWEEYHAVHFGTGGWTHNGKFMGCHHTESSPPPVQSGCSDPATPRVDKFNLKPHGRWYDSTPLFYGKDYCTAIGFPERLHCPARSECPGFKCEERLACEQLGLGGAAPLFRCEKGSPDVNPDNPFQARCYDSAWIEVCHNDGKTCTRVVIP